MYMNLVINNLGTTKALVVYARVEVPLLITCERVVCVKCNDFVITIHYIICFLRQILCVKLLQNYCLTWFK
jgi:hypothetical protein